MKVRYLGNAGTLDDRRGSGFKVSRGDVLTLNKADFERLDADPGVRFEILDGSAAAEEETTKPGAGDAATDEPATPRRKRGRPRRSS
jgi:hypothetical protein